MQHHWTHRLCTLLAFSTLLGVQVSSTLGAVSQATQHAPTFDGFDNLLSSSDLIQGLNAEPPNFGDPGVYENPGDLGWHPANTNPDDLLPAFTDGLGGVRNLTGLLNENFIVGGNMPESGAPVKVVEYVLAEPSDIGKINILSGNRVNSDGRIFMSASILYSTNDGATFQELGYFQSDPSGSINSSASPVSPFDPAQAATFVSIFDDASSTLLSGVTNLEFSFYAVDNDDTGQLADPFDGLNPFTGEDDALSPAFKSPLIWEIDVLAPSEGTVGDYNNDGLVNAADYTVWRDTFGDTVPAGSGADGSGNGSIDLADYNTWVSNYGASGVAAATAAPEPAACLLLATFCGALAVRRPRRGLRLY
ncbi:hypothetical protein Pla123a_17210 [Posidoniimonas polymericola]|uniref:PEP-CTERM protein-sorting domain-containing protein n=1 Tax=Posidoniimonas polymericola TaxID=2528002 RepID=A0A5C5YSF7_9BACT|nr:hypothetical protein [Posidoniimonas polymericola]TWT77922.1 hypothetical protein Pla123a_17210 [Posidoniimonas polymericola]